MLSHRVKKSADKSGEIFGAYDRLLVNFDARNILQFFDSLGAIKLNGHHFRNAGTKMQMNVTNLRIFESKL